MTKFTNKSWSYGIGSVLLWLSVIVMSIFVGLVSYQSIIVGQIYLTPNLNNLIFVAVVSILLMSGFYLAVLLPYKNVFNNSYLILNDKGVELEFMDYKFQPQHFKWKWKEIVEISEQVGVREYEFAIVTKEQTLRLPLEIYQNTVRVNQIKKALKEFDVKTRYSNLAKIILLVTDVLIGFVLVFVLLFLLSLVLKTNIA